MRWVLTKMTLPCLFVCDACLGHMWLLCWCVYASMVRLQVCCSMYVSVPIFGLMPVGAESSCILLDFSPPTSGVVNDGTRTGMV